MNNNFLQNCTEEGNNDESGITRPTPGFLGVSQKYIDAMDKISGGWKIILEGLHDAYGLNCHDPNFIETPDRIAKMMVLETCSGINSEDECRKILSKSFPAMGQQQADQLLIVANPHLCFSICPHHFSTVAYKVWISYVPDKDFIGVSKFSRCAEIFARQPILQESYVSGLADIIYSSLKPKGVAVIAKAVHFCMVSRGAKTNPNSEMVSSSLRGCFVESNIGHHWKSEFISLCNGLNTHE